VIKNKRDRIRQSQLVTTFGPGAMIDLPDYSVIMSGTDQWNQGRIIKEDRLRQQIATILGRTNIELLQPPSYDERDDDQGKANLVVAFKFPGWGVVQHVEDTKPRAVRRLISFRSPEVKNGKFQDSYSREKYNVSPVRFVRSCYAGHVDDIDWRSYVHNSQNVGCTGELFIEESGVSNDLSAVIVQCCACGATRPMSEAKYTSGGNDRADGDTGGGALGKCSGRSPWLGDDYSTCNLPATLLIRTASNAYFPHILTVISIPSMGPSLVELVAQFWDDPLKEIVSERDLEAALKFNSGLRSQFAKFAPSAIWTEIQNKRAGASPKNLSTKQVEIDQFLSSPIELPEDDPAGDFFARKLRTRDIAALTKIGINEVVLIHRLREVVANIGFTRIKPSTTDIQGDVDPAVSRAPVAKPPVKWVPAYENRGEGIFIRFDEKVINKWVEEKAVQARAVKLRDGIEAWNKRSSNKEKDPGIAYIMLHSFAHLLLTEISLSCGYPASSLKERIYATPDGKYGVLIYTGSADAEGTLGGLVQTARDIQTHIFNCLKSGKLCSNDPICSTQSMDYEHDQTNLNGAACHACLLVAETSCERFNSSLDRALIVPTIGHEGVAFFKDI
jgi:hypothetical protein